MGNLATAIRSDGPRFLRVCFEPQDWTALLLTRRSAGAVQRIGALRWACNKDVQEWLRQYNTRHYDVYASVNPITSGAGSRARCDVDAVRHVFLDVDQDTHRVMARLERRSDLPPPSYVVHTSPKRAHVLWRVRHFDANTVEPLQKRLATVLGCDLVATSVTQMTRLPGFWNHKYREPHLVWVEYRDVERVYTPRDFPSTDEGATARREPAVAQGIARGHLRSVDRARSYLSHVPPAVTGHHGDLHTFQTCCRVVRGFAMDDEQALAVLAEWNARCQPPWTERELREKIRSARRNGREPIGGLL